MDKDGHRDAYNELIKTINSFKNNMRTAQGELLQCVFPARYILLKEQWPQLFKKEVECQEFENWKHRLGAGDLSIAFASSYPNNPASMFGHTFLHFDRKNKGSRDLTQKMIGYTFSFQANTDVNDGPFMYTLKGVTGGYNTALEIKPYYINIGIYNNLESRSIWEYKLNLDKNQKDLLLAHAWELSIHGSFEYFFFDENCSSYLARFLEVIYPSITINSKNDVFVLPQQTLREILNKVGYKSLTFWPSSKDGIKSCYQELTADQQNEFIKLRTQSIVDTSKNNYDMSVLDCLIDFYKLQNYKSKTKLDSDNSKRLFYYLNLRSLIAKSSNVQPIKENKSLRPHLGHDYAKFAIGGGDQLQKFNFRYGFHNFYDPIEGLGSESLVDFMNITYSRFVGRSNLHLGVVDILSLSSFEPIFSDLSWRARYDYFIHDQSKTNRIFAGVGLSKVRDNLAFFGLIGVDAKDTRNEKVSAAINIGFKYNFNSNITSAIEYLKTERDYLSEQILFRLQYNKSQRFLRLDYDELLAPRFSILIGQYF